MVSLEPRRSSSSLQDLLVQLTADFGLLLLAHQDEFSFLGDRIDSASGERDQEKKEQVSRRPHGHIGEANRPLGRNISVDNNQPNIYLYLGISKSNSLQNRYQGVMRRTAMASVSEMRTSPVGAFFFSVRLLRREVSFKVCAQ